MRRKIFGYKRNEVRVEWRRLHNEELHNFFSSTNTPKTRVTMTRKVAVQMEINEFRIFVEWRDHLLRDLGVDSV